MRGPAGAVYGSVPPLTRVSATQAYCFKKLKDLGGIGAEGTKEFMFEVRIAAALKRLGHQPAYEFAAGVGNSTIDFRVPGNPSWLIEVVRVKERDVVRNAAVEIEVAKGAVITICRLSADAQDGTSEECEFVATQRKILEKAFRQGKPTKFPDPKEGNIHMILIDLSDCNLGMTDSWDHWLLGWGNKSFAHLTLDEKLMYSRYLDDDDHSPFLGLFDSKLELNGAEFFRSRIHLLGFVREEQYEQREIEKATLVWNNHLFADQEALSLALKNCPIRSVAADSVQVPESD